ncbi:uncharacterized protein TNCV_2469761 [Trichonephila clavipes]|nr:uncharacterized protein TNCV_2469761 [Trichonephila clavipes]
MLCDAREFPDEIDILANFELTQPRPSVRRRNVNFDYEAREDSIEDPTLKYKAEFYFFTLDKAINALESRYSSKRRTSQTYCKNLETVLTDGNSSDINALDLADEIVAV